MNTKPLLSRRFRKGMSLLEVMVALVIIVVLFSVAFPVFNKLKERAIQAKTGGQMRTIISGFHDYALDHSNFFPPAYFPDTSAAEDVDENDLPGEGRWLDTTIYAQLHPDKVSSVADASEDAGDNTTQQFSGGGKGEHLKGSVFEIHSSLHKFPNEDNWYNHTVALNRDLITDPLRAQQENPEFSLRNRDLFIDDANTMLIIEAEEGDHNSVSAEDREQIEAVLPRNNGKFIHVGFMDGHVERMKMGEIPETKTINATEFSNNGARFWQGLHPTAAERARRTSQTPDY